MPTLESGLLLGSRFSLIRRLGRGGMGEAWLARDRELASEVVVKVLPADAAAQQVELLRQECLKARRLSHPNIVRVFDFQQHAEASFLVMEFVEGGDIGQLRGAPLTEVLDAVVPLADALDHAHRAGIVHRDLKCSNVLLDADRRPRLSDFGIAGILEPRAGDLRISGGGSSGYASPQQSAGERPSPADDVFGMGALLYELLGGAPPVPGSRPRLAAAATLPLPEGLEELVDAMLSPAVEDRPASMAEVREALASIAAIDVEPQTVAPILDKREIRLSPPPRVPAVRAPEVPIQEATRVDAASTARGAWWVTAAAVVLLAGAVFSVFVLLPRWVAERGAIADREPQAASSSPPARDRRSGEVPSQQDSLVAEGSADARLGSARPAGDDASGGRDASDARPPDDPGSTAAPPAESSSGRSDGSDSRSSSATVGAAAGAAAVAQPSGSDSSRFADAMTAGLQALETGDFEGARRAFETALAAVPESTEAADGLARAELELRLAAIAEHRRRAAAFERDEKWREAVGEYLAALNLDPTLRFAQQGLTRAEGLATLSGKLAFHIDHPDRLVEDQVLAEARDLLSQGRAVQPMTPDLSRQLDRLSKQIEVATTPVSVLLLSDNLTEVVVYRVGRLGRFDRKTLELRPGTYTVVGSRPGFRDVRQQLEVVPDRQDNAVSVRCEEPI